ncbi:MAG: hypothetical protein Q8L78_07710 [Coxiellaceae bacterium]|nr:hypothetical protein [Coxiellaceae bacterium]
MPHKRQDPKPHAQLDATVDLLLNARNVQEKTASADKKLRTASRTIAQSKATLNATNILTQQPIIQANLASISNAMALAEERKEKQQLEKEEHARLAIENALAKEQRRAKKAHDEILSTEARKTAAKRVRAAQLTVPVAPSTKPNLNKANLLFDREAAARNALTKEFLRSIPVAPSRLVPPQSDSEASLPATKDAATITDPVAEPLKTAKQAESTSNMVIDDEILAREKIEAMKEAQAKLFERFKASIQEKETLLSQAAQQKKAFMASALLAEEDAYRSGAANEEAAARQKAQETFLEKSKVFSQKAKAHEALQKIIAIQGKSYFDDYATKEDKKAIAERTQSHHAALQRHSPDEARENKSCLHYRGNQAFNLNYKTDSDRNATQEIKSATAFFFTEKKSETESVAIQLIREAKPFDPQKKSRDVVWRVEGKTQRTLAEQYDDIAQQSFAFRIAEDKILDEEITSLESTDSLTERLQALKALKKNSRPHEITISLPNQFERNRKNYSADDFKDLPTVTLSSRTVRLSPMEFLALKAHLKYFSAVWCNGVKFSASPTPDFFSNKTSDGGPKPVVGPKPA